MKTLYALVGICMSLHAFAAFADTPALMGDDDSDYIDVRETLAPRRTGPDTDVVTVPTIGCPLTVNQNTNDRTTADVVPATIPIPHPALMRDDDSDYINVRETLAPQRTAPDTDVVTVPTIGCPLTVNQNTDDRTKADVVPATIPIPQSTEDQTSTIAGPWAGDTE